MARGRGGRGRGGRRGGRSRSRRSRSRTSSSKSRKRSTRRRSTAASKRRRVRSVAKAKRARNRTTKSTTSTKTKRRRVKNIRKTLKQKIASAGLNKKKTETKKKTISASASRKQVRQKTKEKVATRKKIGLGSIGKAIGNLTKGRAAHATGTDASRRSKLRQQLSNLRSDIAQKSTKEARFNRRADRLKRQFGLDTRDMRNLKINVDVGQAARHYGLDTNRYTKGLYGALPKAIKKFRFNTELGGKFRSPHKLGVREGYRRPTQGGQTIAANTKNQLAMLSSIREHPSRNISRMYDNLLGRKADQEGLDYWTNEFLSGKTNMEGIRKSILASEEFQGRSDVDKQAAYSRIPKPKFEAPPMKTLPYFPDKQPDISLDDFVRGAYGKPDAPLRKQEDWLGNFYKDFNIGGVGGKLDDEARNYWSGEAKKHGRGKVLDTIRATAKKQGTWGGRSRSNKKRRSGGPNKKLTFMPLMSSHGIR